MSFEDGFYEMVAFLIDFFLISWVHDMIEPKLFFFVVFSLHLNAGAVGLVVGRSTSSISSISV